MTLNNHTLAYAWAEVKTPQKRKKRLSQDFVVVAFTALKYFFSNRKVVSALVTFDLLFIKHEAWPRPCWQTELGERCLEEFACHNKASSFITWSVCQFSFVSKQRQSNTFSGEVGGRQNKHNPLISHQIWWDMTATNLLPQIFAGYAFDISWRLCLKTIC